MYAEIILISKVKYPSIILRHMTSVFVIVIFHNTRGYENLRIIKILLSHHEQNPYVRTAVLNKMTCAVSF